MLESERPKQERRRRGRKKHGTLLHHGFVTVLGKTGGGLIYSDTETWCEHCKKWIKTPGVLGQLKYMAEHRDGDCVRKGSAS